MNARKILITGNLALLVVLALMIAKLTGLPQRLHPATLQAQDQPQEIQTQSRPLIDHRPLATSELFGHLETTQPEKPKPAITLDHLQLLGTVIGTESATRAFIRNKTTQTTKLYKLNDWIDDVQLIKVARHQVTLKQNNQLIKLQRTHEKITDAPTTLTPEKIKPKISSAPSPLQPNRKKFTQEIEVLLKAATATPTKKTNPTPGLTLSGIGQFHSARNIGLQEGDIIQSINGHQIISKKQMFQVLQKAKTEPTIDIEISRDGQTILLSLEKDF